MKKALITGVTGQDGSYLTQLLLSKDYEVHGIIRRSSSINTKRLDPVWRDPHEAGVRYHNHYGDLSDSASLINLIRDLQPDEIYNLASQSHVKVSFEIPEYTSDVTGVGVARILEAVRASGVDTRFYQASSSEMFGAAPPPQNEQTTFHPRSPYGVAKVFGHWMTVNYREAHDLFACSGILFNHESPRRGETFVSRKITRAVARIKANLQEKLYLGNLEAKRDWGYAPEYCVNRDVPVLTVSGWKYCDEVEAGDEIINFDPVANCLSRDKVLQKIEIKAGSRRIVLKGRGFFLRCTPQHRIFYQQKRATSKGGWSDWKVTTAEEFCAKLSNLQLRTRFDYRLPHFADYSVPDDENWSDEKIYLVGALLAEGCVRDRSLGRGITVSLSQSEIANRATFIKIQSMLTALRLTSASRTHNGGTTEWVLNADSSREVLTWFDGFDVHVMPKWCYSLSNRQANILFEAMMDCDGSWGGLIYVSKRYALSVAFQTIAHLAGYRTTGVRGPRRGGCYEVGVISRRKRHPYVQEAWEESGDAEEAWCVSTTNGTIVTRDEECISISGNCEAMWMMLQQERPDDYVIATGESHSVREFAEVAFNHAGLDWEKYVEVDSRYFRPSEVDHLMGDCSKAAKELGWEPKTKFDQLARLMVDADIELLDDQLSGRAARTEHDF